MPRILPWQKPSLSLPSKSSSKAHSSKAEIVSEPGGEGPEGSSKRRRIRNDDQDLKGFGTNSVLASVRPGSNIVKKPTSFTPPVVEYMIPSDELYIMVEDELNDVAHLFTRSLHEAEYERLQSIIFSKHADNLGHIHRPKNVLDPMAKPNELSEVDDVLFTPRVGKHLLTHKKPATTSEDEEEDHEWEGTSLGPLMTSPRKSARDLRANRILKRKTKAAAGLQQSQISFANFSQRSPAIAEIISNSTSNPIKRTLFAQTNTQIESGSPLTSSRVARYKTEDVNHRKAHNTINVSDEEDDDLDLPEVETLTKSDASPFRRRPSAIPQLTLPIEETHSDSHTQFRKSDSSSAMSDQQYGTAVRRRNACPALLDDVMVTSSVKPANTVYKGKAFLELQKKRQARGVQSI